MSYKIVLLFLFILPQLTKADFLSREFLQERKSFFHLIPKTNSPKGVGLSYKKHIKTLERVADAYEPIFVEKKLSLTLRGLWDEKKVQATSFLLKETAEFVVVVYGGLPKHPLITEDAYVLILCHEIGHHLGGAPSNLKRGQIAASEGQADYFATTKCARKVFAKDNNYHLMSQKTIPEIVKKRCKKSFNEREAYAICIRSSLAAKVVADLARAWIKENRPQAPRFSEPFHHTPNKTVVSATEHGYTSPQCRLDTYFAGATCEVSHKKNFSYKDPDIGACLHGYEPNKRARPLCWYKP